VPRLLGPFCKAYPEVEVQFNIANRSEVIRRLQDNLDDLAVMMLPPDELPLHSLPFLDNPLVVIAPREHPLARAGERVPLAQLAPLFAQAPEYAWFSLQKGSAAAQAAAWPQLLDYSDEWQDFADTAALVAQLDLVITVDTAMAHLSAALGKPTWVLSRFDACWRWLDGRSDSPWYPGLRLFHQISPGDWATPLAELAGALGEHFGH